MFKDEILEKIFDDKEMKTVPIGCQATVVSVIDRILEETKEANPYGTISELFTD